MGSTGQQKRCVDLFHSNSVHTSTYQETKNQVGPNKTQILEDWFKNTHTHFTKNVKRSDI